MAVQAASMFRKTMWRVCGQWPQTPGDQRPFVPDIQDLPVDVDELWKVGIPTSDASYRTLVS